MVLTAHTHAGDGKWRYLILADSHRGVEELESRLAATLQLV